MKRFLPPLFNLFLISLIGFGLSGCVSTRLPLASNSPWKEVDLSTQANPLDISFEDSTHGFLVGTNRLILETDDGGDTWTERVLDIPSEENFRLISIDLVGQEGWIAGQPGLLLHTKDGGQNWTRLNLGSKLPGEPFLITTLGDDSAELATTAGAVYKTNDAGATWEGAVSEASGGVRDLRRSRGGD